MRVSAPWPRVKGEFYRGTQETETAVWEEPRASCPSSVAEGSCAATEVRWSAACPAVQDRRACASFPPIQGRLSTSADRAPEDTVNAGML